jgi:pimeloyl-ACP methyl ester carboxylesterase
MRHHPGQWLRSTYVGLFQLPRLPERLLTADRCRALRRALTTSSRPGAFAEADLDHYVAAWLQPGAMTGMLNWYRALVQLPRARPPRVRVPVLILWGRRDTALQPGLAEASLAYCDAGQLRWYERASHWLAHEEPEAVNADLAAFLR